MNELTKVEQMPVARREPSPAEILQAVCDRGITPETVAVVKELSAMCKEAKQDEAKAEFAKAFFQLRKVAPNIYADKEVRTDKDKVAFSYVSPEELNRVVEPLLLAHGFTTMCGQEMRQDGKVTAILTLFHEAGHSETREFTVRVSAGNAVMNNTKCDEAATTSALRHLMIKMLGLKTRINANDDARLDGGTITAEQAASLRARVRITNTDESRFLKFAGNVYNYEEIPAGKYGILDENLRKKETKP